MAPSESPTTCSPAISNTADFAVEPRDEGAAAEEVAPSPLYSSQPEMGEHIGTIALPTLNLSWPIVEGTGEEQLAEGVGHFPQSVLPGIRDNSVLSGHRTTVFGRLGELAEGDPIVIETTPGVFTYEVMNFEVVAKTSREVIVPTDNATLTLTTCYPFYSPLPTTEIFVVRGVLIDADLTRPVSK